MSQIFHTGGQIRNRVDLTPYEDMRNAALNDRKTLEEAADFLQQYIQFCYMAPVDEIERHPYIPAMEQALQDLWGLINRGIG